MKSLQGTWRFEIIQTDGWPKPKGKGSNGEEVKLSFTIDPRQSPKHFDVTFLNGPHKGQTCRGLYERGGVGGVVLWLCLVDPGSQAPRPMNVSYATHEGRTMIGLIRVDPPEEKPREKAERGG